MNFTQLRKLFLKLFLGFLAATALVAIVSVIQGEFGELQWKILGSCLTISAASICSMCCAAFIEKRRNPMLGMAGILLSVSAGALTMIGIWPDLKSVVYWKTTATLAVAAAAFAHGFLLALPSLDERHRPLRRIGAVFIGMLTLQIIVGFWGEIDNETYFRILAVVAILVGLETLAIPILAKLRRANGDQGQRLVLARVAGNVYQDESGTRYELNMIDPGAKRRLVE